MTLFTVFFYHTAGWLIADYGFLAFAQGG